MQMLKICFATTESVPYAKTGGLADFAGSLPKAIRGLGYDIRVVIPAYRHVDRERFGLQRVLDPLPIPMDTETKPATIYESTMGDDVPIYFVENPHYFDREYIYGYEDDADRFIFFCRAALEMCRQIAWQPDVLHCNDWQTAIIPNWMHTIYAEDPFFKDAASIFTIHNLQYQGIYDRRVLRIAGIDEYGFIVHPEVAPDLHEVVDLMARGILFADVINTISPTYAKEILTPEFGERLDPLLRDRRDHLFGILNGIDTEAWNPATDNHIASAYGVDSLERRAENKVALRAECNLPQYPDVPLIGMITRLADQKGLDLVEGAIDGILDLGVQFVLLGTGDQRYHDLFYRVANEHPDQAAVSLTFNAPLAHKIYAGSDMFLMPSRFEPCGLGQMIAMRYGCIPIVRAVGGLADAVKDIDTFAEDATGFSFVEYSPYALHATIERALEVYTDTERWRQLMVRAMKEDFSWANSAKHYVRLYHEALKS